MKHSCCFPRVRVSLDRLPCYNSNVSIKLEGTAKPQDCLPVSRPQAAFPSSAHMPPPGHLSNPVSDTAKEVLPGCYTWPGCYYFLPPASLEKADLAFLGVEQTELHQAKVQTPNCSAWLEICDQAAMSGWRAPWSMASPPLVLTCTSWCPGLKE